MLQIGEHFSGEAEEIKIGVKTFQAFGSLVEDKSQGNEKALIPALGRLNQLLAEPFIFQMKERLSLKNVQDSAHRQPSPTCQRSHKTLVSFTRTGSRCSAPCFVHSLYISQINTYAVLHCF